jgi:hypothetical protein
MKNTGYSESASVVVEPTGQARTAERRREGRCALTAAITAVDPGSGAHIEARTTDITLGGCYVDAMSPFPAGSFLQIRLTKDGHSFDTRAHVTYCQPGVGMGLEFTPADPKQLGIVKTWLAEARGDSKQSRYSLEEIVHECGETNLKTEVHYAIEELLVVLMRKGILSEEEGEPILRRLLCR